MWVLLGITIVLTVLNIWFHVKAGGEFTVEGILEEAKENYPVALQVKEVAEMAVGAAEEFARTNDLPIPPKDKLKIAINVFRRWIPLEMASDEAMIEAIHSFIPKINALTPPKVVFEAASSTGGNVIDKPLLHS